MRVRIKQDPQNSDRWTVEIKNWWSGWWLGWSPVYGSSGDGAKDRALRIAKSTLNPEIIEVQS